MGHLRNRGGSLCTAHFLFMFIKEPTLGLLLSVLI